MFRLRTLLAGALALALFGCSSTEPAAESTSDAASETSITVTDSHGHEVTLDQPAERAVFLVENAMLSYLAVGGGPTVVGTGQIWQPTFKEDFLNAAVPGFTDLPVVASMEGGGYDLELLVELDPDLVVAWATDADDAGVAAIEETLGVPVYSVFLTSRDDLAELTVNMGILLDAEERANEVNDIATELLNRIEAATADIAEKPSVYWMWGDVYGTAGTESSVNDVIESAGGVNAIAEWADEERTQEHPIVSLETLHVLAPDVIYLWFNDELDPADILEGKTVGDFDFSTWADLPAVVNGQVFELDDPFAFDLMAAHMPIGVLKIASDINPAAFADWDLAAEQDALFTALYGLHYPSYEVAE
jgi:iron complex transport system substrate-binding protein